MNENLQELFDVVIIGAGPAGLTSAIYAKRAELKMLIIEDPYTAPSQITNTYEVENYTGFDHIDGQSLYDNFRKHAEKLGVTFFKTKVSDIIDFDKDIKILDTKDGQIKTKNIILATGATPKRLGCKGEKEYTGTGVSYCATCDGAFFKDKIVAVVGGGDVAIEDAIFLSRIAKKVYVIIRKNYMRAAKILQTELMSYQNVEVLYHSRIEEIYGESIVGGILIKDTEDENKNIDNYLVDGVFIAVGIEPASDLYKGKVSLDESGFVIADESGKTNIKGLFAVGDVRTKKLRQVITACADGANAINSLDNLR